MATAADAEVILRLYELRQEEALRRARKFMVFEFNPKNLEELRAVSRNPGTQENAYWRQTVTYWEMAASFVLRGAVDPELFFDSAAEGVLLYAKFHHFHAVTEKESGNPFMRNTAALIERFPAANSLHEMFLKAFGQTKS
ncbi:DUF4760 domain-containing protein [Edaphobacter bradus]|uniref:DUF4760 domain-containing protein n=1 Tax=Edaphobacter bradus TaxID=2259016 RepID=UPI0021E043E7|nr:hypothetical protein [Edaphobacter bradus]